MRSSNQWLINLSKNESLWATELDTLPSMIHFEYMQLKRLAQEGQVYGVLLQCKDTYETILKIPVIMALVLIDSDPKYKDGSDYSDIMKAFLESPMSMGNWDNLARVIIKKNKTLNLPDKLISILEKTRKLFNSKITSTVSNVVAWRNDTIGHGALKFEDDDNYQEEVKSLLTLLKVYFDGDVKEGSQQRGLLNLLKKYINGEEERPKKGLYDSLYFQCGDNKLIADCYVNNVARDLILHIEEESYVVSNYINDYDLKWYLFDSFYCRKNLVKYSSYIDGKNNTVQNKYFTDLYEKHVLKGNKDTAVVSNYISRAEDLILECLNMPTDYVKPVKLVELLQEQMDALRKGVITVFMERGTGKSAFANQMSGLYHSEPLLKNSLSRCYHVSNAALRGVSDFINSINNGFRHSYNPADDLWGSTEELPSLTLDSNNPAEDMAKFLNFYHDKYQKDFTILVIDGIDETAKQSETILSFIPSKDQLDDGVFVVLTSRFNDEETVQGKSKEYIQKVTRLTDGQLQIRRHDKSNVELLKRYIAKHENRFGFTNTVDKDTLIKKSDFRILYLRAYLAMKNPVALDNTNEVKFIESYMNYLLSFYGINQKQKLKEIAVSIALFPSISIKKYQEYLDCQEITYEFVGLFNDLLPLLTVTHLDGEDAYEFADIAYADFIIEEYSDVVKDMIGFFYQALDKLLLSKETNDIYGSHLIFTYFTVDNKKTNDIIFFSTGFITIWNWTLKHCNVPEKNFDKILVLYDMMKYYPWTQYGYGKFLKNETANCILQYLFLGLKRSGVAAWRIMTKKINQSIIDKKLEETFYSNSSFRKIRDYLINSYLEVEEIEDWFWILATDVSQRVIEIVKAINQEIKFVYRIYGETRYDMRMVGREKNEKYIDSWTEEILIADFSEKCEELILNHLLTFYSICRNNRYDLAKKCLQKIRAKRYRILVDKKVIDRIDNGTSQQAIFHRNAKDSIEILLDFQKSFERSFGQVMPLSRYSILDLTYELLGKFNKEDIAEEDVKGLNSAFYRRINHEKEKGSLDTFLNGYNGFLVVDLITKNIEQIMKGTFGEGNELHEELLKLIESIKENVNLDNKNIYTLLAQMMYLSVECLENNYRDEEALSSLEKLVYEIDTKGFFASYFTFPSDSGGTIQAILDKELSFIYDLPNMAYCTDNALYLLKKLYLKGEVSKVSKLLKDMEKTILAVDKAFETKSTVQAMCSIYKVRFFALRKRLGYQNEFDDYLAKCISVNEKSIDSFLNNLSFDSDFRELSNAIRLRFVFYWITKNWEVGEMYFDKLIMLLNHSDFQKGNYMKAALLNVIEEMECYKVFLGWLNGKELLQTNDETSGLQQSSIYKALLPLRVLHRGIDNLTITKKITAEDKNKVDSFIDIKLNPYSFRPRGFELEFIIEMYNR